MMHVFSVDGFIEQPPALFLSLGLKNEKRTKDVIDL